MVIHLFSTEFLLKFRRVFYFISCFLLVTVNIYELCRKCHTCGDFQWGVLLYDHIQLYELLCCYFWMLITDSEFTRDITEVEHWRIGCRGCPCTRRILVAESPSALLYSSVLLCMALLLQIAVLMVFIWIFPSVKCTLTCLARITGKVAASPQDSFFPLVVLYSWRLKCEKIENVCEGWA